MPRIPKPPITMTPPFKSPSRTSPFSTLEDIKQGNALELQLVKEMRDGFDRIAEGLQRECYNRSDACDELHESMHAMSLSNTNTRRSQLVDTIKEGIRACDEAKAEAEVIKNAALLIAREQQDSILEKRKENYKRLMARERSLDRLLLSVKDMIGAVPGDTARIEMLLKSLDDLERNQSWLEKDFKMHKATRVDAQKRPIEEVNKAEDVKLETCAFADKMQLLLSEMALALGNQLM